MKKIWVLLLAILFVLVGQVPHSPEGNRQELRKLIALQNKTCQLLKEQNMRISRVWDEILNRLNETQPSYGEVKKFQAMAKEAEDLISQSKQRLKRAGDEKNDEILFEKLTNIQEDLNKAAFTHQFLTNILEAIFAPLFGREVVPETPI